MQINEKISKRITSLRFILMIFVVFIHNNITIKDVDYIQYSNKFSEWLQFFISDGICRSAVPIFFIFSAYLQLKKNDNFKTLLKKRAISLGIPYFLWISIFIFSYSLIKIGASFIIPSVVKNPDKSYFNEFKIIDWLTAFFGNYSDFSTVCGPYIWQFWYIRDLFIMMLISPIFVKTIRKFPIEMILFALFFFITGFRPIIVHSQALLFWTLGFLWAEFDLDIFELCDKCKWKILLPIFCGFVIMNKFFLTPPLYAFSVFASIIIMLKFSKTLIKNENFFAILKYLSGFSFFLFAIHNSKFMEFFKTIWIYFLPMKNPLFCLLEYFGVSILVCLSGTAIGICLKKLCPKVFKILTGGR